MAKKKLCVFYYKAHDWYWKNVEWIVCKECQRLIQKGIIEVPAPETRKFSDDQNLTLSVEVVQ